MKMSATRNLMAALLVIIVMVLFLPLAAQGGGILGAGGGEEGGGTTSGGGGGSKHLQMDTFIKDLEKWQKEKPDKYDYLKTLLYKEPFTTSEYVVPAVWVYYESDNTTITRTQDVGVWAYVRNSNPIEIRRVVYLYLEALEPGKSDFRQLNTLPQIVQVNEYDENNGTVRTFPEFTSFKDLRSAGEVRLRVKASDGYNTWYSSNMTWDKPPFYDELVLTVKNDPPELTNVSIQGPDLPKYKEPIEYVVEVADPDGDLVNVTLHILDDTGKERTNETQEVLAVGRSVFRSSEYGFFGERDAGKNFSYYYTFGDGLSSNRTRIFDGPHIKPSPRIWVENPRVVPEDENCYWWQEYTFSLDVRNQDPYEYDLTATLFTDTPSHPWKKYETKTVRVGQEPETVYFEAEPFDVADSNQSFSYRFELSEYDQFGNDMVEAAGPRAINEKIVKYKIYSPTMVFNLVAILAMALLLGLLIEKRFNGNGGKSRWL